MINASEVKEILSTYEKYGWTIKQILLSDELKNSLSSEELEEIVGKSEISESSVDAVWFSRPSKYGKTAWELRHLNQNPFAIFELTDEDDDESAKVEMLKNAETRMAEYASNKKEISTNIS